MNAFKELCTYNLDQLNTIFCAHIMSLVGSKNSNVHQILKHNARLWESLQLDSVIYMFFPSNLAVEQLMVSPSCQEGIECGSTI